MANRFPLIFNSGAGQIQELAASDNLDLTSSNLVNAGILFTSSGSQTAPSLQIGSGTTYNPGLYSPGTDQLAVATNGTERLYIASDGKIGVGTSSPNQLLDVRGNAQVGQTGQNFFNIRSSSGNGQFLFFTESGISDRWLMGSPAGSGDLIFRSAAYDFLTGSERLRITSAGLVGIGSSSPQAELNVAKTGGASTVYIESDVSNNATTSILRFGGASGRSASIQGFRGASSNIHSLDFYTYNSADAFGMRLTSTGLGIGTTSPSAPLHVKSTNPQVIVDSPDASTESRVRWYKNGSTVGQVSSSSGNLNILSESALTFSVNGGSPAEAARIDSSGRLLIGTSTARDKLFNGTTSTNIPQFQSEKAGDGLVNRLLVTGNNGTVPANSASELILARSYGTTLNSYTAVTSADSHLGAISFQGADGTEFVEAASIQCFTDAACGANDMPGRLVFSTTADGSASPTERMRITNGGFITNKTQYIDDLPGGGFTLAANRATFTSSNSLPMRINRDSSDGNLITFHQDSTEEGTISVSGTTVSYNGAHLSRWSQLPSGAERIEILRGSVLSNLDEMCEWGNEDNEQLNRMKVSDVEGDKNVSGVFQCWDDDDDTYTNDFYCAMTGDFIIRIAAGVTVERGDLLMSAGDGTAKPQDDDIIRSKTIAKVTSTNVSCTYEDGSYCVPCVLMAC